MDVSTDTTAKWFYVGLGALVLIGGYAMLSGESCGTYRSKYRRAIGKGDESTASMFLSTAKHQRCGWTRRWPFVVERQPWEG